MKTLSLSVLAVLLAASPARPQIVFDAADPARQFERLKAEGGLALVAAPRARPVAEQDQVDAARLKAVFDKLAAKQPIARAERDWALDYLDTALRDLSSPRVLAQVKAQLRARDERLPKDKRLSDEDIDKLARASIHNLSARIGQLKSMVADAEVE